jgi:hypothetical protein
MSILIKGFQEKNKHPILFDIVCKQIKNAQNSATWNRPKPTEAITQSHANGNHAGPLHILFDKMPSFVLTVKEISLP